MKIAVYSGSFNPLHIGHLSIMEYLRSKGEFDRTYLVISPQSPFKDPSNNETAEMRLKAARKAVSRHPGLKVKVDGIEFGMEPPHYTVRTLDALKEREPDNDFTLIIGADNLAVFRGWRDYRRILLEYGVAVFPREGYDMPSLKDDLLAENPEYRIILEDAPIVTVSSTQIREGLAAGRDMSDYLM